MENEHDSLRRAIIEAAVAAADTEGAVWDAIDQLDQCRRDGGGSHDRAMLARDEHEARARNWDASEALARAVSAARKAGVVLP